MKLEYYIHYKNNFFKKTFKKIADGQITCKNGLYINNK